MLTYFAACIVVPLLLVLWNGRGKLRGSPWPALVAILWFGYHLAHDALSNIRAPREWDYACFWLYGHIAAAHENVYDPAVYARFASPFTPSAEFRAAVIDVGFPYPPPTIALFLPLGHITSVPLGLALWYAVQFAALAGAAWVLGRTFFAADGWRGAVLAFALVLALPASVNNVGDAQTNFLVLLLVALALHGQGSAAGAVWQTLAIWVKPYTAVLVLLDLVRGAWRCLLVVAGTAVVSLVAGIVLVGPAAFATYLKANPSGREPAFAYVESVNQSLLAVVLRTQSMLPVHIQALHQPLFLVGAVFFIGITIVLCARARVSTDAAFGLTLLLGLIVYPGTLTSYGVMLVIPLLVLWKYRAALPGGSAGVGVLTFVATVLQGGPIARGFEANVVLWLACAYLVYRQRSEATLATERH